MRPERLSPECLTVALRTAGTRGLAGSGGPARARPFWFRPERSRDSAETDRRYKSRCGRDRVTRCVVDIESRAPWPAIHPGSPMGKRRPPPAAGPGRSYTGKHRAVQPPGVPVGVIHPAIARTRVVPCRCGRSRASAAPRGRRQGRRRPRGRAGRADEAVEVLRAELASGRRHPVSGVGVGIVQRPPGLGVVPVVPVVPVGLQVLQPGGPGRDGGEHSGDVPVAGVEVELGNPVAAGRAVTDDSVMTARPDVRQGSWETEEAWCQSA